MLRKVLCLIIAALLLAGCASTPAAPTTTPVATGAPVSEPETTAPEETDPAPTTEEVTEQTTQPLTEATTEETTLPEESEPEVTEPVHSPFYIEGLSVEDVITYFNEVCLDAEFINSGNATLLQRWEMPIRYAIYGDYTDEDLAVLTGFAEWLNTIEGFPGMEEAEEAWQANLAIHFCTQDDMISILGDNFWGMDGGVTFWYSGNNDIYNATICYRTDIDQYVRNSVILEEIYNGLGPIQDTDLRFDSLIYSGYTTPQELTEIDELIMKLLYHPALHCGMNTEECAQVIRQLYY